MVCQGDVHYASLVGGHGLQGNGLSRGGHPLCDPCGQCSEGGVASLAVSLHIQDHPPFRSLAHQQVDDELEGSEGLTTTAYEESRVLTLYVQLHGIILVGFLGPGGSLGGDFHGPKQVVYDEFGYGHEIRRGVGEGHSHPGGFGSEAQDSSLTVADYVYFYLISLCAELL